MAATPYGNQAHRLAEDRRRRFEQLCRIGLTMQQCCDEVGVSPGTVRNWYHKHPQWKLRIQAARREGRAARDLEQEAREIDPNKVGSQDYRDSKFVRFRRNYLGMETTWFQAQIAEAIEQARPGEVVLVLIPPEHGKTTELEDWCTYKLADDPSFRITVASETEDHGVKILARVRARLEPDGPTPEVARKFGPFAPEEGVAKEQVWGQKRFNVAKKRASDERDYSMSAVGITGRVQGTRCDLLLIDDVQDVKSLNQSQRYFEIIKQSFLSRPSMFGRTVIIGTRVGDLDVYKLLIDAQIPDRIIRIPAYDQFGKVEWNFDPDVKPHWNKPETWAPVGVDFLWPQKFGADDPGVVPATLEDPFPFARFRYAALRFRVGEAAWWRNYMQKPEAATVMTFDAKTTEAMRDDLRSIDHDPRPRLDGQSTPVGLSLDPAIGSRNAVIAGAMHSDVLEVLNVRCNEGLARYGQIFDILEEECHRWSTPTSWIEFVVVEDKAFQKGILQEDRMVELQRRFGFRVMPNTTGKEKTDKDIGVPSMQVPMRRGEITIPWADPQSQEAMKELLDDLRIWRPGIPGTKLPQDCTMALWFLFRKWRGIRHTQVHRPADSEQFASRPSPLRRQARTTTRRQRQMRPRAGRLR